MIFYSKGILIYPQRLNYCQKNIFHLRLVKHGKNKRFNKLMVLLKKIVNS